MIVFGNMERQPYHAQFPCSGDDNIEKPAAYAVPVIVLDNRDVGNIDVRINSIKAEIADYIIIFIEGNEVLSRSNLIFKE